MVRANAGGGSVTRVVLARGEAEEFLTRKWQNLLDSGDLRVISGKLPLLSVRRVG